MFQNQMYSVAVTILSEMAPRFPDNGEEVKFVESKKCDYCCIQVEGGNTKNPRKLAHLVYEYGEKKSRMTLHESVFDDTIVEDINKAYETKDFEDFKKKYSEKFIKVMLIAKPGYCFKNKSGSDNEISKSFKGVNTGFGYERGATMYHPNGKMMTKNVVSFEVPIGRSLWGINNPEDPAIMLEALQEADKWLNSKSAVAEVITTEEAQVQIEPFNPAKPIVINAAGTNVNYINTGAARPITKPTPAPVKKEHIDVSAMDLEQLQGIINEHNLSINIGWKDKVEDVRKLVDEQLNG